MKCYECNEEMELTGKFVINGVAYEVWECPKCGKEEHNENET